VSKLLNVRNTAFSFWLYRSGIYGWSVIYVSSVIQIQLLFIVGNEVVFGKLKVVEVRAVVTN
jgi:hypothetical protein